MSSIQFTEDDRAALREAADALEFCADWREPDDAVDDEVPVFTNDRAKYLAGWLAVLAGRPPAPDGIGLTEGGET